MGKSSDVIIGFHYKLGMQMSLALDIDAITNIYGGEREAWSGNVITDGSIYIDKPELFGGEKREGGYVGKVSFSFGTSETPNAYAASFLGADTPAYVGEVIATFEKFQWSSMNPYFKAPWFTVRRIFSGWDQGVWYSSKAAIGIDMNPVHIVYNVLTGIRFGAGYSPSDLDNTTFTASADTLFNEGLGMSMLVENEIQVKEFVQIVLDTINGVLRLNRRTGKIELKLIRGGYDINTLPVVNEDNVVSLESFERSGYGDLVSEITVKYTDRMQNAQTVTVQDMACIEAQVSPVPGSREYLGIRTPEMAMKLGMRDLNTLSQPLAKIRLTVNRTLWQTAEADVFAFSWAELGLVKAAFRVVSINNGTLSDATITVEAVEDVFGMPTTVYTATPVSEWVDPIQQPLPALETKPIEAPYWDVIRTLSEPDIAALPATYGFGQVMAAPGNRDAYGYTLMASALSVGPYGEVGQGYFSGEGSLATAINAKQQVWQLNNVRALESVTVGSYAICGVEYVRVDAINLELSQVTVSRGVLDTVPAPHIIGSRVYFSDGFAAFDRNARTLGQTIYYKALPRNTLGGVDVSAATPVALTFANRAFRPYPPANMKWNDVYMPDSFTGVLTIAGSTRNRLTQTVALVPDTAGAISPESGTTWEITFKGEDGGVIKTVTGLANIAYTLSAEEEYAYGKTSLSSGRTVYVVGIGSDTSAASASMITTWALYGFVPVQDGWLAANISTTTAQNQVSYVNGTTGVRTNRSVTWKDVNPIPGFSLKAGVPQFDEYQQNATNSQFSGDAIYWNDEAVTEHTNLRQTIVTTSPIRDRRTNPQYIYLQAESSLLIGFSMQKVTDSKKIRRTVEEAYKVSRAAVVAGTTPYVTTAAILTDYNLGRTTTLDNVTGKVDLPRLENSALGAGRSVIFGSIAYIPIYLPTASYNSAGKQVDITRFLTAHIDIATNWVLSTRVYTVESSGNLTLITTHTGQRLADQLNGTEGFDIDLMSRAVRRINATTGAVVGSLGTLPVTPAAVLGDVASEHIIVLDSNGVLRRYNTSLTQLGSISVTGFLFDPTVIDADHFNLNPQYTRRGAGATAYTQIAESQGNFYVQFNGAVWKVAKDFTSSAPVTTYSAPRPITANPSSPVVTLANKSGTPYYLITESAPSVAVVEATTPRLNDRVTVEAKSWRDGYSSWQTYSYTAIRYGYGLRYGAKYGDGM